MDRVQRRVEAALEPHARHRQEQTGHRHGEQTGEREEVAGAFRRHRARVTQPSAQEDEHASEHQHGRDIEGVEDEPTDDALGVELQGADARHVHLVVVGALADALEVQQSQRQRDRDEPGEDATPEHQLMGEPPCARPAPDETLGKQVRRDQRRQRHGVACLALPERIPTAPVQHRRRWPPQPDRVPVRHAEHREDDAEQIADERGVEPHQPVAADERQRDHDRDTDHTPRQPTAVQAVRGTAHAPTLNPARTPLC